MSKEIEEFLCDTAQFAYLMTLQRKHFATCLGNATDGWHPSHSVPVQRSRCTASKG